MKVLIKDPGLPFYRADVKNKLKEFQAIVGGYIECEFATMIDGEEIDMIIDEEGRLKHKPVSLRNTAYGDIYGTAVFCRIEGEGFVGLTEEQMDILEERLDVFVDD